MAECNIILDTCNLDWGTFWSAVSAIFTAIASIAIILGIRQLQFDAWLKAQEIFTDDDFVENRAKIFTRLSNPNQPWTDDEKKMAEKVCRKMDELARLVPFFGLFPFSRRKLFFDTWDDPLAKTWLVLKPVVKQEQERCKWPAKWKAFEELGQKAVNKLIREGRISQKNTTGKNKPR